MRDEQTGSWWQQVTGRAIAGPLKGKQLTLVPHDEVAFGIWKADHPNGRVLKPDAAVEVRDDYASLDWERRMPVGGLRFVSRGTYNLRAALGLTIGGIPAVLLAAFVVKSLPLTVLRWLVVAVVLYTAIAMLRAARRTGPPSEL